MRDLSLHILDIAENSINADARNIEIMITEDAGKDLLTVKIIDDGKGMASEMKDTVTNPFVTTRTTRKVGLGLPLLKAAAEMANGKLTIESDIDKGTKVTATFQLSHVDRKPLGNMSETILTLVAGNPEVNIRFKHRKDKSEFTLDTAKFRKRINSSGQNFRETLMEIKKYLSQYNKIT